MGKNPGTKMNPSSQIHTTPWMVHRKKRHIFKVRSSRRIIPFQIDVQIRRIQDHPPTCWCALAWEACEAARGPRHRCDARCSKPEKSHLRVCNKFHIVSLVLIVSFRDSNKLKLDACEKGTAKERRLRNVTVNYLSVQFNLLILLASLIFVFSYRYGSLIVFANYLVSLQDKKQPEVTFTDWLKEHREITKLLGRRSLE